MGFSQHTSPMRLTLFAALLSLGSCVLPHTHKPDYGQPLAFGVPALLPLGPDDVRPHLGSTWIDRTDVLPALERSLAWTRRTHSEQFFPKAGITHARALASLERMTQLLRTAPNASSFNASMQQEFQVYKSAGWDGRGGGVLFTGYCTPILAGSLTNSATYRYPLYALPGDLEKAIDGTILGRRTARGLEPYPTRQVIEASGLLQNRELELVWLRDPLDAFIAHVNGSAFVRLDNGQKLRLGYAGKNGQPYTSLGSELIRDGEIEADSMNLMALRQWAAQHPERVDAYLDRNDSYVFFVPIDGNPRGSLNVEVSTQRSLATDKSLFPRGAAVFVDTFLPIAGGGLMPF